MTIQLPFEHLADLCVNLYSHKSWCYDILRAPPFSRITSELTGRTSDTKRFFRTKLGGFMYLNLMTMLQLINNDGFDILNCIQRTKARIENKSFLYGIKHFLPIMSRCPFSDMYARIKSSSTGLLARICRHIGMLSPHPYTSVFIKLTKSFSLSSAADKSIGRFHEIDYCIQDLSAKIYRRFKAIERSQAETLLCKSLNDWPTQLSFDRRMDKIVGHCYDDLSFVLENNIVSTTMLRLLQPVIPEFECLSFLQEGFFEEVIASIEDPSLVVYSNPHELLSGLSAEMMSLPYAVELVTGQIFPIFESQARAATNRSPVDLLSPPLGHCYGDSVGQYSNEFMKTNKIAYDAAYGEGIFEFRCPELIRLQGSHTHKLLFTFESFIRDALTLFHFLMDLTGETEYTDARLGLVG